MKDECLLICCYGFLLIFTQPQVTRKTSKIKLRIKEWLHWGSSLPLHLKMGIFAEENEPFQSETYGYIRSLLSMGYSNIRKLYMVFLVCMGIGLSFRVAKMLSSLGND